MDPIKEGTVNGRTSVVFRKSSRPVCLEQSALKKCIVGHEVRERLELAPLRLVKRDKDFGFKSE